MIHTVITHSEKMHQDEVFALSILQRLYPQAQILRTRERIAPEDGVLFVDVGGTYDHENRIYDHHHRGGAGTRENQVQYASAGLIWKHYGNAYLQESKIPADRIEEVWKMVDERWFQSIDAFDCGDIEFGRTTHHITGQNLRDIRFSHILDAWNATDSNRFFPEAVRLAQTLLDHWVESSQQALEARSLFQNLDPAARWIELPRDDIPWREFVAAHPQLYYILYPRSDGLWNILAVPLFPNSMTLRKGFPEAWRGLSDKALQSFTGVPDSVFCHATGFLFVSKTREAALQVLQAQCPS